MAGPNPGPPRPPSPPPGDRPGTPIGASITNPSPLAPRPSITSIQSAESTPSAAISTKPSYASLASTKGLLGAPAPIAGWQGQKKAGLADVPESPASPRQDRRRGALGPRAGGAPGAGAGAGAGGAPTGKGTAPGGAPAKAGYKKRLFTYLVTNIPAPILKLLFQVSWLIATEGIHVHHHRREDRANSHGAHGHGLRRRLAANKHRVR